MPEEQDMPNPLQPEEPAAGASTPDSTISTSETQTTHMEVHHHPDLHHKRKKFREYILEFFMIFLAVTMGFFAESIREHYVEVRNTRLYLQTFRQELVHNKRVFVSNDSLYKTIVPSQDSIIRIFFEKRENQDLHLMGRLLRHVKRVLPLAIDKAAYQAMVNSGGLKNIDDLTLRDSMSTYIGQIEAIEAYNSIVYNRLGNALPEIAKLEDMHDWGPQTVNPNYVPETLPYPELTERERRLIINYYAINRVQFSADMRLIERMMYSNDRLMKMVDEILGN
jgi:hypothetical protein